MPAIKSYVSPLMNKKRAQVIIYVDDPQSSSGRRGRKVSYSEKYADDLKTCFSENGVGFKPAQVWLKDKSPEGVGATDFPSDKQIKTKFSALK